MAPRNTGDPAGVTYVQPCFEKDNFSYILMTTPSFKCVSIYVFLCLLAIVIICGNLLVIISILYFRQLHTPTNYLILSLAVADLLVGVLVFPLTMASSLRSCLYHDELFCKLRGSLDVMLSTCSILSLCCISIDRYYAVCQPLTYKTKINHRVALVMILLNLCLSALTGVGVTMSGLATERCEKNCSLAYMLLAFLGPAVSFYLPAVVMLCVYMKIFLVAQKQARSIQSINSGGTVCKMERKATKTLAIVMGVFLLCWTPLFICITLRPFSNNSIPQPVIETLNWLTLSNSMLNPFIYAFFYSWFRSAFRMIISGKIFQGDFTHSKLS